MSVTGIEPSTNSLPGNIVCYVLFTILTDTINGQTFKRHAIGKQPYKDFLFYYIIQRALETIGDRSLNQCSFQKQCLIYCMPKLRPMSFMVTLTENVQNGRPFLNPSLIREFSCISLVYCALSYCRFWIYWVGVNTKFTIWQPYGIMRVKPCR